MKKYTIVGIGELLFDVFPDRKALGGAPTNFAFHCQQLGHEAISVSAVGCDALGEEIKAELQARQLPAILQETDYPTGTVQVTLSATGSPTYEISEGVAWDHIAFTDELRALAQRTDAVCSVRSHSATRHLARRSSAPQGDARGKLRIFDINLRLQYYTRETIYTSLEHADILKLNDEEVPIVARLLGLEGDMEAVCRQVLTDYSLRAVILTRGQTDARSIMRREVSSIHRPTSR